MSHILAVFSCSYFCLFLRIGKWRDIQRGGTKESGKKTYDSFLPLWFSNYFTLLQGVHSPWAKSQVQEQAAQCPGLWPRVPSARALWVLWASESRGIRPGRFSFRLKTLLDVVFLFFCYDFSQSGNSGIAERWICTIAFAHRLAWLCDDPLLIVTQRAANSWGGFRSSRQDASL